MIDLITIYSSNIPIDCHILKGRLESDGIDCFIFDENLIWVHPFWAIAIGGVKLKVPVDQAEIAKKIFRLVHLDKLFDENGEYDISTIYQNEIQRQNQILETKFRIRQDPKILDDPDKLTFDLLDIDEKMLLIESEKRYQKISKTKRDSSWSRLLYELFDFDRNFFKYLRTRPVEYYIDKDLVENYFISDKNEPIINCPKCNSDNVSFGYAIDDKWHILFLIFSILVLLLIAITPFPPIRKNHHCFNCGHNFF